MKRILIMNGDDFGYARGVDRAIMKCFEEGILRSATLMANGPTFHHAVNLLKERPSPKDRPGVGVHLVLTGLKPLCRPGELDGLTDDAGRLPQSPEALLLKILRGEVSRQALVKELDRQVARILDHNIRPTHLDSHKHVHVLPQVLDAAAEVAQRHGIRWVRYPFESISPWSVCGTLARNERLTFYRQHLKGRLLHCLRRPFHAVLSRSGLKTADSFFGISTTGLWTDEALRELLMNLPPGITECMVHPGDLDAEMLAMGTRLKAQRERERDLLLAPGILETITKNNIELHSYGELPL